jgi:hypothetical protein
MKSKFFPSVFTPARFTRPSSLFLAAIVAVLLCAAAQQAYAHHPIVQTANAVCNADGSVTINFTVISWDVGSTQQPGSLGPHDGADPVVDVLFNGFDMPAAFTGAFVDPIDSFSGSAPAPAGVGAGSTVHVSALADGTWGDGFPGGENSDDFGASIDVTIPACAPPGTGRFTGGGQQVIVDPPGGPGPVELAKGFEVECDRNPMHENLELNWQGNHFHMNMITSAHCDLVPPPPNPPKAPVNRIVGTGTGDYNGAEGYTVVFTLIDHGEPGAGVDESGFKVCKTADPIHCPALAPVVLDVPVNFIENGNIQAHVDQQ